MAVLKGSFKYAKLEVRNQKSEVRSSYFRLPLNVNIEVIMLLILTLNNQITIQERSKKFAVRIVNAYTEILKVNHFNNAATVLAKQLLRSGTSIGANCKEGISAQSKKDFISKYEIALKEARETEYWIEVMIEANIVPKQKFQSLQQEIDQIIRILVSSINSVKTKI